MWQRCILAVSYTRFVQQWPIRKCNGSELRILLILYAHFSILFVLNVREIICDSASYRIESKRMSHSVDWALYPPAGELLRSIRVTKCFWKLAKAHQHYLRSSLAINDTAAWTEVKKCFVSSWKSGFRKKRIKLMRISTLSTWAFFAFLFTYSTGYLVWSFTLNWLESKSPNNWTSWSSTSSIEFILLPQRYFGERDVKSDLAWHLYLIVYNYGKCLQKERNWGDIA